MISYNQAGQEQWVRSVLQDKRNGFFVDLGAYDGIESSNTFFLEKDLQWDGLCIESNNHFYAKLVHNRKCRMENIGAMGYTGNCVFNGINTYATHLPQGPNVVKCDTLNSILLRNNCPKHIDYISMDIEGNEADVLEQFPFKDWDVHLFTIEHNLYLIGDSMKNRINNIMTKNGYRLAVENVMCPTGPYEDWYEKIYESRNS